MVEEFQLTLSAPAGLPEQEYAAIRRATDSKRLRRALPRAARAAVRRRAGLEKVRVRLSR